MQKVFFCPANSIVESHPNAGEDPSTPSLAWLALVSTSSLSTVFGKGRCNLNFSDMRKDGACTISSRDAQVALSHRHVRSVVAFARAGKGPQHTQERDLVQEIVTLGQEWGYAEPCETPLTLPLRGNLLRRLLEPAKFFAPGVRSHARPAPGWFATPSLLPKPCRLCVLSTQHPSETLV